MQSILEEKPDLKKKENRKKIATSWVLSSKDSLYGNSGHYSIYSNASSHKDTLLIKLEFFSTPHEENWVFKLIKGKGTSELQSHPLEFILIDTLTGKVIQEQPDTSHLFINERIILNKRKYKKGDVLRAKVYFSQVYFDEEKKLHKINYFGLVQCKVR